jgi:hypothetical protein
LEQRNPGCQQPHLNKTGIIRRLVDPGGSKLAKALYAGQGGGALSRIFFVVL